MPIVAMGAFSCNSYLNCRFLQGGQNCDGDSCAFGQHFPSGATKRGVSDGRIQGTVMTALLWSATQGPHQLWMKAVFEFDH